MLPRIVRFNAEDPAARLAYAELAATAGLVRREDPPDIAVGALVERLEWLVSLAGMPRWLEERGVKRTAVPELAREAAAQWTAGFNPRPIAAPDFEQLYEAAFSGPRSLYCNRSQSCISSKISELLFTPRVG
jgi:alcohol dehydrogenase